MEILKYLENHTLENLINTYKINITKHESLPLIILNYDQIESRPAADPIVRECRGLVLEQKNNKFKLVAKAFDRFFNWGQYPEDEKRFIWNASIANKKIDGSLVLIYNYNDEWHINTRGSFGNLIIEENGKTWGKYIEETLDNKLPDWKETLNKHYTYVFEFVSPETKVVIRYPEPNIFLLAVFNNLTYKEISASAISFELFALMPDYKLFYSFEQVYSDILANENKDFFEGYVIKDVNNLRFKIKSPKYLSLHALRGQNENRFMPKYLVPIILSGDVEELLTYFPEVTNKYNEVKQVLEYHYNKLLITFHESQKYLDNQKEFALFITKDKYCSTKFSSILFDLKKRNQYTLENLKNYWRKSSDLIIKMLF